MTTAPTRGRTRPSVTVAARITWLFALRSGPRDRRTALLAATASAVSALVLLLLVAAYAGSGARADRTEWLSPTAVTDETATAIEVVQTQFVNGKPITVVNLAQLPDRPDTPPPPGLTDFPAPGEIFVSPALARALVDLPENQLADRFPDGPHGTLGSDALSAPDELMVVIGRAATDPQVSITADVGLFDSDKSRTLIDGFAGTVPSPWVTQDRRSVLLAAALLVVPVLVLSTAAGKLGALRHERRLATMRLTGSTTGQTLAISALGAAATGAAGALAGTLAYGAALPALAQWHFGIGTWFTSDLWVGWRGLIATLVAVVALATIGAVAECIRPVRTPLQSAQQSEPRSAAWMRAILFVGAFIFLAVGTSTGGDDESSVQLQLGLVVVAYCAFWVVGPWVTDRLGRVVSRLARRPATLLAGRRLSDDPSGAWRSVNGLVMLGFIAGFSSVVNLGLFTPPDDWPDIAVTTTQSDGVTAVRDALNRAGVEAAVRPVTADDSALFIGDATVVVDVDGGPAAVDTAVTAVSSLDPAVPPRTADSVLTVDRIAYEQLRQIGVACLILGFAIAAVSAGATAASAVLDKRRTYRALGLIGAPMDTLERARLTETLLPLIVLAGATTGAGMWAATKINDASGTTIDASSVVRLAICLVVGAAVVLASVAASGPLLRTVTTTDDEEDDR